jgi:hypothetical protein
MADAGHRRIIDAFEVLTADNDITRDELDHFHPNATFSIKDFRSPRDRQTDYIPPA